MSMEGKIALVTGASRGIGAAIADALAQAGARVIGTATTVEGAEKIRARLAQAPSAGEGRVLNVSDAASMESLMVALKADDLLPDILVNNAGITRDQILLRMTDDDWDDVMTTNLKSVFKMSKFCLRHMMKARSGRIINIASVIGLTGNPGQANYAAAKAGIIAFTKSLAREVGSRGITANVVAPGFIDTDMTRELEDGQRDSLMSQVPLNRLGRTADIAGVVVFLAGDSAAYITGETIHVNGGMYMA